VPHHKLEHRDELESGYHTEFGHGDVIFGNTGVVLSTPPAASRHGRLTFTNTVSSYNLTSSASQTLSG